MTAVTAPPVGDLMAARPRVRSDAVLGAAQRRGPARFHLVRVLGADRSLEIGAKEHFVIARLDGSRSLAEIGQDYEREFGKVLGPASWGQILGSLHRSGLLASGEPAAGEPGAQAVSSRPPLRPGRHKLLRPPANGLTRTIPVVRQPSEPLDRMLRWGRAAFTPWLVLPVLAAVLAMEVLLGSRVGELAAQTVDVVRRPGALLAVAAVTWVVAALHETAHGVAARRYGVPVREIGVRWVPPLVMPYCRTDGYLYLPRRGAQVVIAGAGVLVELVLLLPAFAAWWWWAPGGTLGDVLAAVLLCGSVHALLNLLPIPPLDGYRMLSHALGLTDYAQHSGLFVALAVRRDPRLTLYPRGVRAAYAGYAALTLTAAAAGLALLGLAGHAWLGGWPGVGGVAVALALALVLGVRAARRRSRPRAAEPANVAATAAAEAVPATQAVPMAVAPRNGTHISAHARGSHPADHREPALRVDGVVKAYAGRRVVDEVTLHVAKGEFLGLLGPNGAGKTTLVELAVGLRRADGGAVSVLGESPWPRRTALLRRIGVQTQSAAFFVRLTAREHLRTVAALYGLGPEAAERALHQVGLQGHAGTRAERLSGGQQQRLAIATALVHEPELIFLDEPTASLDPQARRELWSVLRDLHADGRTVVYTTHHLDEAEALCDRVAIMAHGHVVATGAPHELIDAAGLPTRVVLPRGSLSLDVAARLPRVTSARLEGPSVVIETHDSLAVLTELEAVAGLRGVQTRTPTLEDVYLARIASEATA